MTVPYDAIIVGSGPNGMAAAITLARAGMKVLIREAQDTIGGGLRTRELTLPGFHHDVCATVLALGALSPFMRSVPLSDHGLEWVRPPAALAHPLDDGTAAVLVESTLDTAESLGADGRAYRRLMDPLVDNWQQLFGELLGPLPFPPRHPLLLARFGLSALQPARGLAERRFQGPRARALFAGLAAHSFLPLEKTISASFGMMLGLSGHVTGWPVARGGSQSFADALADYFCALGGQIETGRPVRSLAELPPARAVLFDLTPRQILAIAGDRLPSGYRRQLENYRYGPGVFKLDLALSETIPWKAPEARRAGTLHLGGTLEEIAASERAASQGRIAERPFVLLVQSTRFDPGRAPAGQHTAWAYCHVPNGSTVDMTARIEAQIERFAPGFRDTILARSSMTAIDMQAYNANYIGGDINGGVQDIRQLFTRPARRWNPYRIPVEGLYICSSSTPPGGGVHGMSGYHAARTVLGDLSI